MKAQMTVLLVKFLPGDGNIPEGFRPQVREILRKDGSLL